MIKIENLKKSFGELEVLKNINLNVDKGEVVAIIGPSGTGKSTLLRCINLLETPTSGIISIGNHSIDTKTLNKKQIHDMRKKHPWYSKVIIYLRTKPH